MLRWREIADKGPHHHGQLTTTKSGLFPLNADPEGNTMLEFTKSFVAALFVHHSTHSIISAPHLPKWARCRQKVHV